MDYQQQQQQKGLNIHFKQPMYHENCMSYNICYCFTKELKFKKLQNRMQEFLAQRSFILNIPIVYEKVKKSIDNKRKNSEFQPNINLFVMFINFY